jgi:hypothetical protein
MIHNMKSAFYQGIHVNSINQLRYFSNRFYIYRKIEVTSGSASIPSLGSLQPDLSTKIDLALKEGIACYKTYTIVTKDKLSRTKYLKEVSQDFTYFAASFILDKVSNMLDRSHSLVFLILIDDF